MKSSQVTFEGEVRFTGTRDEAQAFHEGFITAMNRFGGAGRPPTIADQYELNGVIVESYMVETAQRLCKLGEKVGAIKLVRGYTKAGLKEAKDFCDGLPPLPAYLNPFGK